MGHPQANFRAVNVVTVYSTCAGHPLSCLPGITSDEILNMQTTPYRPSQE